MSRFFDFLIDKGDLRNAEWREVARPVVGDGQVLVQVDRFAFTANNVTYALYGDRMGYWKFYPGPEGLGKPPVWGFATIAESRVSGMRPGERIYGLLPISSHCVLSPGGLQPHEFEDVSPWRGPLAAPYNRYLRIGEDPNFAPAFEAVQAIFRPLYSTSFLIADFLEDHGTFGAENIVISSASSKTSLGLGFALKNSSSGRRSLGLTSHRNQAFVRETGYFDEVMTYDQAGALPQRPSVYVDMAGGATLRSTVHHRLGELLVHSCAVGGTQWEDPGRASGLPGAKPTLFFAPARVEKRRADWGVEGFEKHYGGSWGAFLQSASSWLEELEFRGRSAVQDLYSKVVEGEMEPRMAPMGANLFVA